MIARASLLALAWLAAPPADRAQQLAPCPLSGVDGEALCGTLVVPEDRSRPAGRAIPLRVVVLRALAPGRPPAALAFLTGGPGEAATADAAGLAQDLRALRRERDLLLVDARGTGESNPLRCDLWDGGRDLSALFPLAAVGRCRDALAGAADLRHYTSLEMAADLEAVRAWLGYDRLDLFGSSYGTRLAQVYARLYPEHVRTLVLQGVVAFGDRSPLFHARNAERALDLLARECASDERCGKAFPRFRAEVDEVLSRLDKSPVRVSVEPAAGGAPDAVLLTRSAVAEVIRFSLYRPQMAARLPLRVHQAHGGDFMRLARTAVTLRAELPKALAFGLWLSATCAEDVAAIDPAAIPAATAGTFFGDDRVREQLAACAAWPARSLPADFATPLRSEVPTLLLSGERDPVTPPEYAAEVARHLPRGRALTVPSGTHGGHDPCLDRLIAQFVLSASVEGLDSSCLAAARPTEFLLAEP